MILHHFQICGTFSYRTTIQLLKSGHWHQYVNTMWSSDPVQVLPVVPPDKPYSPRWHDCHPEYRLKTWWEVWQPCGTSRESHRSLWKLDRTPFAAYFGTPPHPMEDWKGDWKVNFSYLKEDPSFWSSFFHWDSGSSVPSRLPWVAEPIMAPCILFLYSHNLGSFAHFCSGWAVSLLQTSR